MRKGSKICTLAQTPTNRANDVQTSPFLENRRAGNRTVSSNLTSSAINFYQHIDFSLLFAMHCTALPFLCQLFRFRLPSRLPGR
jgi:hypothetical protein